MHENSFFGSIKHVPKVSVANSDSQLSFASITCLLSVNTNVTQLHSHFLHKRKYFIPQRNKAGRKLGITTTSSAELGSREGTHFPVYQELIHKPKPLPVSDCQGVRYLPSTVLPLPDTPVLRYAFETDKMTASQQHGWFNWGSSSMGLSCLCTVTCRPHIQNQKPENMED